MGSLRKGLEQLKFDSRMTEWNESQGIMTREEYQKHLDSLPDLSGRAVPLTLEDETNGSDILSSGMDTSGGHSDGGMDPSTH
ncbi:MAG: hypothetical protein H6624_15775 [Bdellovibrionaceae bacterium]|nr:hypothetical protein [Bdellovibrionales bacterium]MCB9085806.1 hypothetical protein [Pseudobdellovibrionaceae bacterium]